ncbi:hypothetical protein GIB67_039020 [Kingdonia uniflora]|uniref:Starch synthase catalytic domain-containing protein n=1 Tax=Kingdonia uniflora TaxID=39325 RepID=A0A7J7LKS0_9MAGN|nr:hypothetical protein GIB67_039020 [Kingdonia uniflora]
MGSEDAIIKVENEEEMIKCEVEDGCNPEVKKPSDGVRVHETRRSYNVRTQNYARLRRLLDKLMKNHSWKETCGVLSVLLRGTRKEEYRVKNRDKYWAAIELDGPCQPTKIMPMYELWMTKNKWLLKESEQGYQDGNSDCFSLHIKYLTFPLWNIWEQFVKQARKSGFKTKSAGLSGVITCEGGMNLVFVVAEVGPWSKNRGLGDVLGGLPPAMAANGHRVMTVSPRYDQYKDAWDTHFSVEVWGKNASNVYGPMIGKDYTDNQLQFSLLCQVDENICKFAQKGLTPSQIGVILCDSHGFTQVKSVTVSKILRIIKSHGLAPEIPEDLYHLIKKAVAIKKHLEMNKKDKDSKFRLILVESRIHRRARYYKRTKKLPPTWKYEDEESDDDKFFQPKGEINKKSSDGADDINVDDEECSKFTIFVKQKN